MKEESRTRSSASRATRTAGSRTGRGSEGNSDGYCNRKIEKAIDAQSMEADQDKRKLTVWEIERRLAEDVARPVLYQNRSGTCWQPYVKGYTPMVNSIYNGIRMEQVWLDR